MRKGLIVGIVAVIITLSLVVVLIVPQILLVKPPGVPQNLSAIGDVWKVTIQWSKVTGATSYCVYWSTTPGFTKTSGTKIEVSNSSYVHKGLAINVTYYYLITAVGPGGESNVSNEVSATTRLPRITGAAILPDLYINYTNDLPGGGLYGIFLSDLSYNVLANDTDTDPSYSFSVEPNRAYVLTALYNGGQGFAAVTPTISGDLVQNISIDTEVAMDLIIATEKAMDNLEPTSLSRPLDDLLADANQEVANLNAFYEDRNKNRNADRIADAIHALTMDKLNKGEGVSSEDLDEATIRAYGGGLQGIRSLSDMLANPKPPLNPEFTFTRYNSKMEKDFGMSDLETKRWDYLGTGIFPHITTGGTAVLYIGPTSTFRDETHYLIGVYKKVLGSTGDPILLTPLNIDCLAASWSPDETKIAFVARDIEPDASTQPFNLFVMDADGSNLAQLTYCPEPLLRTDVWPTQGADYPSWSPNGSEIIFNILRVTSEIDATHFYCIDALYKINADGTNMHNFFDRVDTGYSFIECPSWSPDGSRILFDARPPGENDAEIIVIPSDFKLGDNITILTQNDADDVLPSWSYDGRFIIFSSIREGETGTLPGVQYLYPFYVINSYTEEVVADFGDFADAGCYYGPRFTAIEAVFKAKEGVATDEYGNAIISGFDNRCADDPSINTYYREIIPAANEAGIDYYIPDW